MKRKTKSNVTQNAMFQDETIFENKIVSSGDVVGKDYSKIDTSIGLDGDKKSFEIYMEAGSIWKTRTTMEDKKLIEACIKTYQIAYDTIIQNDFRFNKDRMLNYLKLIGCNNGVCYYSRVKIGVPITQAVWMKPQNFPPGFKLVWGAFPSQCQKPEQMILAISYRLHKLKEIYENLSNNNG